MALPDDYAQPGLHDKYVEVLKVDYDAFTAHAPALFISKDNLAAKYPNYLGSGGGNDYFEIKNILNRMLPELW